MRDSVPSARYSSICNVLRQWSILLIPTYRVDTGTCMLYRTIHIGMYKHSMQDYTSSDLQVSTVYAWMHALLQLFVSSSVSYLVLLGSNVQSLQW